MTTNPNARGNLSVVDVSQMLADAEPAAPQEQRHTATVVNRQQGIAINYWLLDSDQQVDLPLVPQDILVVDPKTRQPYFAGGEDGCVPARIELWSRRQDGKDEDYATRTRLDFESWNEDFRNKAIGRVSCIDLMPSDTNGDLSFKINAADPRNYSQQPLGTIEEQQRFLLGFEQKRRRTVIVDDKGANPSDPSKHDYQAFRFFDEENVLSLAVMTANPDNSDFKISKLNEPEVSAIGTGDRKLLGMLHFLAGGRGARFWGPDRILGTDNSPERPRTDFALITTMHDQLEPLGEDCQDPYLDNVQSILGKVLAHTPDDTPDDTQRRAPTSVSQDQLAPAPQSQASRPPQPPQMDQETPNGDTTGSTTNAGRTYANPTAQELAQAKAMLSDPVMELATHGAVHRPLEEPSGAFARLGRRVRGRRGQ